MEEEKRRMSVHKPWRTVCVSFPFCLLASLALASGCGRRSADPRSAGASTTSAKAPGAPGERPELPTVPVAVEPAARGTISSYYSATATLEPEKQAQILARVSGVVLEIKTEEGDEVREGQSLLTIQDDEYRIRLDQANAEKVKQQAKMERSRKMFEQDLLSSEAFEAVKTDLKAAEAAADLAALELSYTDVRAPFAGCIVQRYVDQGQTVANGTALFDIADAHPLLAKVHVPAKEFRNIRTDQPVELALDSSPNPLDGVITLVSPVVDPTSGTIKVTVRVDTYPTTVRPGDFAEVRIVTARHDGTLLVPKVAVLADKGERIVFVAKQDSTAERRVVTTGFENDRSIEVLNGLADSEPVVIQGQRSLKDGQPVKILEALRFEEGRADTSTSAQAVSDSVRGARRGS
jgi:membrane fusion protein (multidrug efflux system)